MAGGGSFFVVFVLLALVVLAVAVYSWLNNQKRLEELGRFCLAKGWQFSAVDDSLAVRWTGPPFFEGSDRHARAVVRGTTPRGDAAWPFVAFDYTYVTETSDGQGHRSSTTHRYAICAVTLPAWLPSLTLTPENVLTRMGGAIIGDDIELESEDFNRRYRVQSPDPKFASDVLPPLTMEMLLARPSMHFRVQGQDVLCWESGSTTPMALLPRLATLTDFVAGIPGFVWHDYGIQSGGTPGNKPEPGGVSP